jgi:hypothetical protein
VLIQPVSTPTLTILPELKLLMFLAKITVRLVGFGQVRVLGSLMESALMNINSLP